MTIESNYVIAIDTLSDWLKRVAPVFQPIQASRVSVSFVGLCALWDRK